MADFLDALSPEAEKRLKSYHNEVLSLISDIGKANASPIGGNSPSGSTSAIKALTDQVLKLEEANSSLQSKYVALAASQKNNITLINGQAGATSKNTASTKENAIAKQILNAEENRNFRANTLLAGAYAKASAQLLILKKNAKDYAIALGETHPKTLQAVKDSNELAGRINAADRAVGDFQRNVGNYNYSSAINGLKSLTRAFGLFSGVYLFAAAVKHGIDVTRDFEKANADLAAYMGKTRVEISDLTQEQLRLAVATRYSAVEIVGVQKELAKSGFSNAQIKEATLSILNFASAVGVDLEKAVQVTDNVLKVFNYNTAETTRVNDVMAKAFTSSRLRIEDFTEAMKYVAPTAAALKIPFERVVALLAQLANNGIKGSSAGTGLRRILVDLTKDGANFEDAFSKLNKTTLSSQDAFERFGRLGQTTALVLNKTSEEADKLTEALNNAGGAADKMAKEQLETLDGKIHVLQSSWDTFIISLSNSKNPGVLSWLVVGLTEGLNLLARMNSDWDQLYKNAKEEGKGVGEKTFQDLLKNSQYPENLTESEKIQSILDANLRLYENYANRINYLANTNGAKRKGGFWRSLLGLPDGGDTKREIEKLKRDLGQTEAIINSAKARLAEINKPPAGLSGDGAGDEEGTNNAVLQARLRYLKALADASKEQYEAEKLRRQREIDEINKVAVDEKATFEGRISAYGEMLKKKEDLLTFSFNYESAQNQKQREVALSEADKAEQAEINSINKTKESEEKKQKEISQVKAYYAMEREQIDKKYNAIGLQNTIKYNTDYLKIVEDTSRTEIQIRKKRDEVLQKIEDSKLARESAMFKKVSENEKMSVEVRQQAFDAYLAIERKRLDLAKMREKAEASESDYGAIDQKYIDLNKALTDLQTPLEKDAKAAQDLYDAFAKTLTSDIFKGANLGSFEQFFDGSFKKTLDGFDSITDKATATREKAAYAFVQIAEAAQEAFNFINQAQEQQFQAQIDRLGREKEVALGFAGESADAREEIERQYTERVKQLHRQEAEAQKRNAIFNILINTAQGIAATIGQLGFPAAIPFIAAIGIIGAAQAALVASQPIPEFEKGTDNAPIGWAKVDEKGAEIHTDKHGKLKSLGSDKGANYRWLDKGDKIYTAEKSREMLMFNNELNGILSNNGISSPIVVNNGISEEALTRAVIKGLSSQSQGDSFTMVHDARGIKVFQQRQNRTTELMNNKKSFTANRIR